MADKKISQLVDGGPPQATDEFVIDRAGLDNFKLDWASLKTAAEADSVLDGDAAGGVLGGTYPNPSFAVDMATQAELDALAASAVLDGDTAGGVLGGTYPNPGFAVDMATQAELDALAASALLDGDAAGGVLSGTYPNPGFAVDMATQAELDAAVLAAAVDYGNVFLLMGG